MQNEINHKEGGAVSTPSPCSAAEDHRPSCPKSLETSSDTVISAAFPCQFHEMTRKCGACPISNRLIGQAPPTPQSIRAALNEAAAALAAAGADSPGLDASLLLANVLNTNRSSLIAAACEPLTETVSVTFHALIRRRLSGECTAYILGKKEFYGLEFSVNPSVLVPRPDTETLVETALAFIQKGVPLPEKNKPPRILDICTGSGAIAVALKHTIPDIEMWAADISPNALETARTNAARLLPEQTIHFRQGDLFAALDNSPPAENSGAYFSLIVSNPPYIPSATIPGLSPEVRAEPTLALDGGRDGLEIINRIIAGAAQYLYPGAPLLLEADPRQMKPIAAVFTENGFTGIQTFPDLTGRERVIAGIKPNNS